MNAQPPLARDAIRLRLSRKRKGSLENVLRRTWARECISLAQAKERSGDTYWAGLYRQEARMHVRCYIR